MKASGTKPFSRNRAPATFEAWLHLKDHYVKKVSAATSIGLGLCDRIRIARRSAQLSKTDLAKAVGVTPSAAGQWEHPQGTQPSMPRLQAIASATGATFQWLATGQGVATSQRRGIVEEEIPAIALGTFARDFHEETLLTDFRKLSPRVRNVLTMLVAEMTSSRR
jgi:transcriptional regulator with XRE-family HTH domain